jgi:hypothetical protein
MKFAVCCLSFIWKEKLQCFRPSVQYALPQSKACGAFSFKTSRRFGPVFWCCLLLELACVTGVWDFLTVSVFMTQLKIEARFRNVTLHLCGAIT